MDPEQLREFEEQMRSLTELMSQQNSLMAAQIKAQQDAIKGNKSAASASNENAEADKKQAAAGTVLTKVQEAETKAKEEGIRVQQNYERALDNSIGAVQGFAGALVSSTEGVGKYGNALSAAGDAAWDIGKNFGIVGKIIGGSVNVLAKLGSDALQLTDSITNLRDETVKFTGALPVSAGELGELAKQARYSLADMAKLQKATASVGTGLTSLGATAGQGAVKFMEVAAVSDDVRRKFGKMGISQEALTDLQAKYMKQQSLAGNSMELQRKSTEQLRKESLAYAENMTRLSALTGKSADQIQQEQEVVKSQFEEQMKIRQENARIQELKAIGTEESLAEAKRIQKERDNRTAMLDKLTATMGPEMAAQFGRVMRTGAFDKFSAGLASMGVNAQELAQQVKDAPDPNKLATDTFDKYDKAVTTRAVQLGQAGQYLNDEQKKAMGLNDEYMLRSNRVFGKTEEERIAAYEADKKAREESQEALDNNIEAMRSLERETKAAYQSVLEAVNPMNLSFNGAAIASAALAAAATAAAFALGKMAMGKIGGPSGPSTPGKPDKPAAKTPRPRDPKTGRFIKAPPPKPDGWLSRMTKPLSGFASKAGSVAKGAGRFIPGLGQVLMVGGAAYGAYQGASNAEKTLGIEGRKASTGEKFAAGAGGALSALTFGLVSAESAGKGLLSIAERFKKTSGDAKTVSSSDMSAKAAQEAQEAAKKKHEETIAAQKKSAETTAAGTAVTKESSDAMNTNIEQLEKINETTETNSKTQQQALNKFIFNLDQASIGLKNLTTAMTALAQQVGGMNLGGGAPSGGDTGGAPSGGGAPSVPANIGSYMAATAMIESGGNPNARAKTSSAGGMFQFLDSTWKELTKEMGKNYSLQDKFDPKKSAEVMAYFTQKQKRQLEKGTGREASNTDLYMAHFLGSGGAVKFLNAMNKNPNAIAADMDPRAARANKSIYYDQSGRARTLGEVYELMGNKMDKAMVQVAGGKAPAFVQQMAKGGGPASGVSGSDSVVAQRSDVNAKLTNEKPKNVKVGDKADLSGVSPELLKRFFTAAKDFGQPISVNSAYRGDAYQAELWVRGRILGDPSIHTPARPKNDTTISYQGKQYTVEGSGKGSKHGRGEALDISGDREDFDPYLAKYGLHRPFKRNDPPHVELMASSGGIFDGPEKGYNVELHGTELVAPLMKDSLLMKLAQTPAKMDSMEKIFGDMNTNLSTLSLPDRIEKKFSYATSSKKETESPKKPTEPITTENKSDPFGFGKITKFLGNIFNFRKSDKQKEELDEIELANDKMPFDPNQMFSSIAKSVDVNQLFSSINKDTELVQSSKLTERLDPNTMLADVMKKKDEELKAFNLANAKTEFLTPPASATPAQNTDTALEMNTQLMEMLSGKLDTVISVLESGNDVSSKILKTSRV